jgi:hypothetical protein
MEIVDQRENWSKCICGGLTGWMKNEFIGGFPQGNARAPRPVCRLTHRARHRRIPFDRTPFSRKLKKRRRMKR